MLKLCRVTKVKVFFLVLVYVFNFHLFESDAILEKGLLEYLNLRFSQISTAHSLSSKSPVGNSSWPIKLRKEILTQKRGPSSVQI